MPQPVFSASFDYTPQSGVAPLTVFFTNTSTDAGTSWQWDFGDGNTSTSQNPSHTYTSAGLYTVTFTISSVLGSGVVSHDVTVTAKAKVEFSEGLMSTLPANILNFAATYSQANPAQAGLLPSGSGSSTYSSGVIYIMQGTMPAAADLVTIPTADILVTYSVQSGCMIVQDSTNPVVISSTYMPASASGTATWFLWVVKDGAGTIYQQIIGNVGLPNSGAELEISDISIITDQLYRILNLRLYFPSVWPPTVLPPSCCWIQSELLPSTLNLFHFDEAAGSFSFADSANVGRQVVANSATSANNSFCSNSLYLDSTIADIMVLSEPSPVTLTGWTYEFSLYYDGVTQATYAPLFEAMVLTDGVTPVYLRGEVSTNPDYGQVPSILFYDTTNYIYTYTMLQIGEWNTFAITIDPATYTVSIFKNGLRIATQSPGNTFGSQTPATFTLFGGSLLYFDEYRLSNEILYSTPMYNTRYGTLECAPVVTCAYTQSDLDACTTSLFHFNNNARGYIFDEVEWNYSQLGADQSLVSTPTFCGECVFLGTDYNNVAEFPLSYGGNGVVTPDVIATGTTLEISFYYTGLHDTAKVSVFDTELINLGEGIIQLWGFFDGTNLSISRNYFDAPIIDIPMPLNQWLILAMVFDYNTQMFMVYVDGVRILSGLFSTYFNDLPDSPPDYRGSFRLYSGNGLFADEFRRSKVARYTGATYDVQMDSVCNPQPPVPWVYFSANFPGPNNNAPVLYEFFDSSANNPTSWLWDFGDGGTSSSQNTTHTYLTAGTYTATLTATNAYGSGTNTKQITVELPAIDPQYAWTSTDGSLGTATIVGNVSMPNFIVSWTNPTFANSTYVRSATQITGKSYCEFSIGYYGASIMPVGFGVQSLPMNIFYLANGVAMFRGNGGCGLPSSGIRTILGTTSGAQYYFTDNNDRVGIAVDQTTGNVWFSINDVWVSGDPAAGTSPSATISVASPIYYTMGMYSCNITAGTFDSYIYPNQLTQLYNPPAGFTRYQP